MTATEFLKSKNVPFDGLDAGQCRTIAKAYGWAAPKAGVSVVSYTPTQSKKGPGLYLKVEIEGAREGMFRLCDGNELTPAAREVIATIGNDCADLL